MPRRCTLMLGEPPGEVEDDAGEKAGLGGTEQEPEHVELAGLGDEEGAGGEDAPDDHDRGEPAARPEPVQHQVAGHAEDHVAEREDPCAEAEDRVGEVEVVLELELREAHVHAV